MISEEAKKQIEVEADKYCLNAFGQKYLEHKNIKHIFINGAEFGYSLAMERIKELEAENNYLRGVPIHGT